MPYRTYLPALSAVLLLAGSAPAPAQQNRNAGAALQAGDEVRVAQVVIDGEALFSVRGVTALPAERRAGDIEARIRKLAEDPKVSVSTLKVYDQQAGSWIVAGDQRILAVLDEDAAIEGVDRRTLAELYRRRIAEAIEAYRRDRKPGVLWLNALYALGATLALVVAVFIGRRLVVLLRVLIEKRYRSRVEHIEDRAFHIVRAEQLWSVITGVLNLAWGVLIVVAAYVYLHYDLALFPWTRGLAKNLIDLVMNPLRTFAEGFVGTIPNLMFLAVLFLLTRYILKLIRLFFDGLTNGRVTIQGFDPEWGLPTYKLARLLVLMFAVVVAYPYVPGAGSEAFKGVSLFVGIVFSLGSSSLIGNLIAGYSMTYRKAFRIGDRVKIGQYMGDVERTRLLVTHLRTLKNEELVVPNSQILGAEVVNYSSMARERGLILHTTVGIGYETPWRQVEAMLLEAANRTPGLRRDRPPYVLQTLLGDYCVTYELNVYCDTPGLLETHYTYLHRNVLDVFNEFGVQIMTPSYMGDPAEPKVVPKDMWYATPAQPPESSSIARG